MRTYRIECGNEVYYVPMGLVGTFADIRYHDDPGLAPEPFHQFLPSPYVWSITLMETDHDES